MSGFNKVCWDCGQEKTPEEMAIKQYCKDCLSLIPKATQVFASAVTLTDDGLMTVDFKPRTLVKDI